MRPLIVVPRLLTPSRLYEVFMSNISVVSIVTLIGAYDDHVGRSCVFAIPGKEDVAGSETLFRLRILA